MILVNGTRERRFLYAPEVSVQTPQLDDLSCWLSETRMPPGSGLAFPKVLARSRVLEFNRLRYNIDAQDTGNASPSERLEENLARGPHTVRYESADDFGLPETAFNICAFWRLDALNRIGRRDEAIEKFEALLASRNHLGLLSEDTDFGTGEMWGNFPQTNSMVGIINGARQSSRPWETFV